MHRGASQGAGAAAPAGDPGRARAQWLDARAADLLEVPYFHLVFTLPEALGPLALQNKRVLYGMLFRAASETLCTIARDCVVFKGWHLRPEADLSANVRFISELIDTLEAAYNIDPTRIYANGFSNGGAMTFALSCRLSHRIAAVGTVSAVQDQPWSWCADSRPVPLINFHGTADLVPYNGGKV